jgi:hypothetical protein
MNIATAKVLNDSRIFEGYLSPGPVGAAVVIDAG